jgi:hypothetical protein
MINKIKELNVTIADLDYKLAKIELSINEGGNSLDLQDTLLFDYEMNQFRKLQAIKEINKIINE